MKKIRVFYGYTRLTPKIMRKPELAVWFENANNNMTKNEQFINRRINIVYEREQTLEEMSDAQYSNRMFTQYAYKINEKPFNGQIELVLERNFLTDSNHVSLIEREKIRNLLRKGYFEFYQISRKPKGQQTLIFNI